MFRQLTDRRILITGASGGIGRSLAELAVRRGARVLAAARSGDRLDELAAALAPLGGEIVTVAADVTSEADRQRLLDAVQDRLGGLDVLVNNAGVASFGHFADSSEEVLRQIMEVNFFAPAELIRQFAPVLAQGRQPAIVNVGSTCSRRGLPAWPEYSASKFALAGLTEALRGEMARFDIDVLFIVPGLTRSDLPRHLLRNAGRMKIEFDQGMAPEQVAASIIRALEKNRVETVVGRDARWLLRFHRLFPRLLNYLIARRVRQLYAQ